MGFTIYFGYVFFPFHEVDHDVSIDLIYAIDYNNDFKKYSEIKGAGTADNPYVLENKVFLTDKSRILVEKTDAHFIIRNCVFHGSVPKSDRYGIDHQAKIDLNGNNIVIENNIFDSNKFSIHLISFNITVENNVFKNSENGITGTASNFRIIDNEFLDCREAISLDVKYDETLKRNLIESNKIINSERGFYFEGSEYAISYPGVLFRDNFLQSVYKNGLYRMKNVDISNNKFEDCGYLGFVNIYDSEIHNNIINNTIENIDRGRSDWGLFESRKIGFTDCGNVTISSNQINSIKSCLRFYGAINDFKIINNKFSGNIGINSTAHWIKSTLLYNNSFNCSINVIIDKEELTLSGFGKSELPKFDNGIIGNYWNDYLGADNDNNGIGDEPYYIAEDIIDNYPLISNN